MRFIVILFDPDEQQWHAPVVEAPSEKDALKAAAEHYSSCWPVVALTKKDLQGLATAADGEPDITTGGDPETDLIREWVRIGRSKPWIARAADPPFTEKSFARCTSLEELYEKIREGNWCLGTAFYLGNIAFINQVSGGDEWLVIRGTVPFESLTVGLFSFDEFRDWYSRVMSASDEALKSLTY